MKTKAIIDIEKVLEATKLNQKEAASKLETSEQNLISWKKKAPKVVSTILKIQELSGLSLKEIIKEVPV